MKPGIYSHAIKCKCKHKICPRCGADLKAKRNTLSVCHVSLDAHLQLCPAATAGKEPPF